MERVGFSAWTHTSSGHEGHVDSQQFTDNFCTGGAAIVNELSRILYHCLKLFMAELSAPVTLNTSVLGQWPFIGCQVATLNGFIKDQVQCSVVIVYELPSICLEIPN